MVAERPIRGRSLCGFQRVLLQPLGKSCHTRRVLAAGLRQAGRKDAETLSFGLQWKWPLREGTMTIRMPNARTGAGSPVTTESRGLKGKRLQCTYCTAEVAFAPGQFRPSGDAKSHVPPHFHLRRNAVHAPACKYGLPHLLDIIARADSSKIVRSLEDGTLEFHLHSLCDALRRAEARVDARYGVTKDSHGSSENWLAPYLRTATDVLLLRGAASSLAGLEHGLHLMDGNKRVHWRDFYFDCDHYMSCFKKTSTSPRREMLAVVRGVVESAEDSARGPRSGGVVDIVSPRRSVRDGEAMQGPVSVSILTSGLSNLQALRPGQEITALGFWKASEIVSGSNGNGGGGERLTSPTNCTLTLAPKFTSQISAATWSLDEISI
jgi:hypothetical protein